MEVTDAIYALESILGDVKQVQEDEAMGETFKKEMDVCEKYVTRALKTAYKMRLKELSGKVEKEDEKEDEKVDEKE